VFLYIKTVLIYNAMSEKSNHTFTNVRELIETRAAERPADVYLFSETDGRKWTYTEINAAANRTANLLKSHGITKGDVVSLLMSNSAEYVIAYFACFKLGALAGPVNSLLKAEEIEYVVSDSEAKVMLAGSEFKATLDHLPVKREAATRSKPGAPSLDATELSFPAVIQFDDVDALTKDQSDELDPVELSTDDDAIIIYTSGTTGKPKGCLLTHGNVIANARQITEWLSYTEEDRLLTIMPLFHMNAVSVTTMTPLYAGGSTVVSPKFSASKFWQIISDYKITSFGSVATMLSMLLQKYPDGVPAGMHTRQLRFAMCGSAPVPAEVMKKFEETFHCPVIEGYGLSESTCRSTFNPPDERRRAGSCGLPIGNEMAVFDEEDRPVADGELGEIVMRGPNIFKAYFKNEAATEKAFRGGWFHTGDIGYRAPDGFFYIADRKSDMIIRGGENIYPREIDELLFTHPAIASAAVIGVPDELYGEEVAAFIVLKEGAKLTEQEVIDFCKISLADFKCPRTVHFLKDIPKGPTGKLLKRELARMFKENEAAKQ
jgi:acyl-CoA synthetase (AMP-forming)/AMP-acid ligase II